ncbi:MAG: hypothetical protein J6E46_01035 [Faecalicoccus sp.]|nr:hypothetical protein [Faecalicoccus sp.]
MSDYKDFDSIMKEITLGLTGDNAADIEYLKIQMEKYKDHPLKKEILRACGRLLFDKIDPETKEKLTSLLNKNDEGTKATLDEVRFNIYKKDYDKALEIMETLIAKIEKGNLFEDDEVSEYHDFEEYFEEVLYTYHFQPKKTIRRVPVPYTEIYMLYGSLLFEMKQYEQAREALKKGLKWNPTSFKITMEYIETYKVFKDFDKTFELTKEAFKIAFRPADLARCYRNLGYLFIEKEAWSQAIGCYQLSLQFEPDSKQAMSELYYIHEQTAGMIKQPSFNQMKKYCEKYGFPLGPDQDVLGLSYSIGMDAYKNNNAEACKYLLGIAYDLTQDEKIKKILDQLPTDLKN